MNYPVMIFVLVSSFVSGAIAEEQSRQPEPTPGSPEIEAAVSHLAKALESPNGDVRTRAASALRALGPYAKAAVPALAKALDGPNHTPGAMEALRSMGRSAKGAVPAILAVVKRDPRNWEAIRTLGAIGPDAREAVPALIPLITQRGHTADYAREALIEIGPDPVGLSMLRESLAKNGSEEQVRNAIVVLGSYGAAAKSEIPKLIDFLGNENGNIKGAAAYALGRIGREAVSPLVAALRDETRKNRRAMIAFALLRVGPEAKEAIPALKEALRNASGSETSVIRQAIRSIEE